MLTCQECTTEFTEGKRCPHCGSEDIVPKNTVHGGATNADQEVGSVATGLTAEVEEEPVVQDGEGGLPYAEVPDGSVTDVLAWVGDDYDRATAALNVEQAKSTPRVTLVQQLEAKLV